MDRRSLAFVSALLLASPIASAALPSYVTNYSQFQLWLPIIFLAMILSISIVAIYFVLSVLLNNSKMRSSALAELGQVIGTGIIVVVIIALFAIIGTGQFSLVSLLSPSSMSTVCGQLATVGSGITSPPAPRLSILSSNSLNTDRSPTPTNAVCSGINALANGATGGDITPAIDYGLFSTYAIIANLTNQASNNLNAFYVFAGWIGFLSSFESVTGVVFPVLCLAPIPEECTSVTFLYKPYAGYTSLVSIIKPVQLESVLSFYIMVIQLLIITFFLYAWPYMLAAGIILQASFFTRRVGGLLMAISLSAVLIYPLIYAMEYTAFTNQYLKGIGPIGSSNLPSMALYETPNGGQPIVYGVQTGNSGYVLTTPANVPKSTCPSMSSPPYGYVYENVCGYAGTASASCSWGVCSTTCSSSLPAGGSNCPQNPTTGTYLSGANVNLFILPQAEAITRYFNCWPGDSLGGLLGQEAAFAAFYLIPGVGVITGGLGLAGSVPSTPLNWPINGCLPSRALNSAFSLTNMYGIIFFAGIFLPITNLLISLAAMVGFATLFGGDKDIIGLGKLI